MRLTAVIVVCAVLLFGTAPAAHAQSGPPGPPCQSEADLLTVTASVQQRGIPYFIEVEVMLLNRMPGKIQMDPGRFTMMPDRGEPVKPLTLEQAVKEVRNPVQTITGFLLFGIVGLIVNAEAQDRWAKEVEARILKASDLAPNTIVKGSVYFKPKQRPAKFALTLEGLTAESGETLAAVRLAECQMPGRGPAPAPEPAASPTPSVRAVAVSARAASGPVTVSVSNVEFARDTTSLTVTVENTADMEVSLFTAIGEAKLMDNTGKTYAVRMLRSDLPDRVAPRSQARGRLAFEPLPLPPAVTSAMLTIPEIRVGDDVYEVTIQLRF